MSQNDFVIHKIVSDFIRLCLAIENYISINYVVALTGDTENFIL